MTPLEVFVAEQLGTLLPSYEAVDLKATVTGTSFSVEFFATVGGKRLQCFELMDRGLFSEREFNAVAKAIATYVRGLPSFKRGGLNKYSVKLAKGQ